MREGVQVSRREEAPTGTCLCNGHPMSWSWPQRLPVCRWKAALGALLVTVYKNLTNSSPSSDSGQGLSLLMPGTPPPSGWGEPWLLSVCPLPRSSSSCQEVFLYLVSCLLPLYFSSFSSFGSSQTGAFIQCGFLAFEQESG